MVQLYTLLIKLYGAAIVVAALFSEKARAWVAGRKDLFDQLQANLQGNKEWIWFHVSSLGEFEQGRPLIGMIRAKHPEKGILLTFFSPSGYLVRKTYPGADYVTYMPLDTPGNARRFLETVRPVMAVFVKYDIWYHHLAALERSGIPTFLISAQLRADQVYFSTWGGFLRRRLELLTHIFTQTESCAQMLRNRGFTNVSQAGDTRLDRVLEIAATDAGLGWLARCLPPGPVLVAGSTWPEDEERLIPAITALQMPCILAPHEIREARLIEIERQLPGAIRLSRLRQSPVQTRVVIVDTMGELAALYSVGQVAYVGGGFGKGIHNILEPVAHGLPVLIGPRFEKFVEAIELKKAGVVYPIRSAGDVQKALDVVLEPANQEKIGQAIRIYVVGNRGATDRIYQVMKGYL